MPKVVAIIQARMGSTRLPGKVLMDIGGKPALQWVVDAAKATQCIDEIVLAISLDQELTSFCLKQDLKFSICSKIGEGYVRDRFYMAVREWLWAGEKVKIVRLTGDCPFLDPLVIDQCIEQDVCAVDEWPDGMDVQVFDAAWLPLGDREHVIPINNDLQQLKCPYGNLRDIRLTLDTAEDLVKLREIAKHLPKDRPPRWRETLAAYAKLEKIAA